MRAKKVGMKVELFLVAVLAESKHNRVILKQFILKLQVLGHHPYTLNHKNQKYFFTKIMIFINPVYNIH